MNNRDTVDELFERLAAAPNGVDCKVNEVLAACGLFVTAILAEVSRDQVDRQQRANRFCRALVACVDPTKLAQRRPLN